MHFTLMVIGDNWEEQLKPFNEENNHTFEDYTSEVLENYTKDKQLEYSSVSNFAEDYYGYDIIKIVDGEKRYGHMINPDGKWDWYVMGGRWSGFFKVKDNSIIGNPIYKMGEKSWTNENIETKVGYVDQLKFGQIDWEGMKKDRHEIAVKDWEESKDYDGNKYIEYGIGKNLTKEDYIKERTSIFTYAVLKDGEWYEKDWGDKEVEEKWEKRFNDLIKDISDDTLITLVDYHN